MGIDESCCRNLRLRLFLAKKYKSDDIGHPPYFGYKNGGVAGEGGTGTLFPCQKKSTTLRLLLKYIMIP